MIPQEFRFIAIEGPIGVGKTTLAERLARELNAELLLEKPAENPFLERFYQDRSRYALPTQLTFLFERVDQFRAAAQGELFSSRLVSDFLFDKDALFAKLTLSQVEFEFYTRAFQHLQPEVPTPDCVILLRAPVPQLMQRIAQRARAMEHRIDEAYLAQLCAEYNRYFEQYDRAPLLVVDTEAFNPAENTQHFNDLLASLALLRHTRRWVLAPDQQDITA
jgi:deoxyadenosine/deoxycytidine kinase